MICASRKTEKLSEHLGGVPWRTKCLPPKFANLMFLRELWRAALILCLGSLMRPCPHSHTCDVLVCVQYKNHIICLLLKINFYTHEYGWKRKPSRFYLSYHPFCESMSAWMTENDRTTCTRTRTGKCAFAHISSSLRTNLLQLLRTWARREVASKHLFDINSNSH